jgi:Tfp pilus assembly major pilin PilA
LPPAFQPAHVIGLLMCAGCCRAQREAPLTPADHVERDEFTAHLFLALGTLVWFCFHNFLFLIHFLPLFALLFLLLLLGRLLSCVFLAVMLSTHLFESARGEVSQLVSEVVNTELTRSANQGTRERQNGDTTTTDTTTTTTTTATTTTKAAAAATAATTTTTTTTPSPPPPPSLRVPPLRCAPRNTFRQEHQQWRTSCHSPCSSSSGGETMSSQHLLLPSSHSCRIECFLCIANTGAPVNTCAGGGWVGEWVVVRVQVATAGGHASECF